MTDMFGVCYLPEKRPLDKGDYSLVALFLSIIAVSFSLILSGVAYIELTPSQMVFSYLIIIPLGAVMAGIIFTYSLTQYTLQGHFRHIVLIFFAMNAVISVSLYFVSHPAMVGISSFADQMRNRTIVVAFGFILVPSALFSRASDVFELRKMQSVAAIIWAGAICPMISFWFLLSPEPVFDTIASSGPTLATIVIMSILVPMFFLAILRYYTSWRNDRNRLDLAAILSILLWVFATFIIFFQRGPLLVSELIWFSVFICGELLLVSASFAAEIVEPHKALKSLVDLRTRQLNDSKREIEFYLNIWGHKIGNLLQSMMLYLEMFSTGAKKSDDLITLADTALDIGVEANQINRQVAALIKLKEHEDYELAPINLNRTLEIIIGIVENSFGAECTREPSGLFSDIVYIYGDEFIELALENLFAFICKKYTDPDIRLNVEKDDTSVTLSILFSGARLPKDVEDSLFSVLKPARTTLSLDLFTVKILMQRFEGLFHYDWLEESEDNRFRLKFHRVKSDESDPIPHSRFTEITDQ